MSELKHQLMLNKEHSWIFAYPKSEADKVISELKQKLNEAQTELELWSDGSIISEAHQKELDGKRHSDYKRCLAMAERCKYRIENPVQYDEHDDWIIIDEYWERWYKRWIEIAEKFKEAR